MRSFGDFLYELRKEKGMTQTELADRLGITNKAVSKWETGEALPETAQLKPIASIFGITVDELLSGEKKTSDTFVSGNASEDYYEDEAENNLPMSKRDIILTTLGVALIIAASAALVVMAILQVSYDVYVSVLLGCIAIAVYMFIYMGMTRTLIVKDIPRESGITYVNMIGIGVALCIISPIVIICSSVWQLSPAAYMSIFFLIILAAVVLLVLGGILYDNMLKSCGKSEPDKHQKNTVSAVIMPLAIIIYLILGFLCNLWHPGWIVFPIAALLSGVVETISRKR